MNTLKLLLSTIIILTATIILFSCKSAATDTPININTIQKPLKAYEFSYYQYHKSDILDFSHKNVGAAKIFKVNPYTSMLELSFEDENQTRIIFYSKGDVSQVYLNLFSNYQQLIHDGILSTKDVIKTKNAPSSMPAYFTNKNLTKASPGKLNITISHIKNNTKNNYSIGFVTPYKINYSLGDSKNNAENEKAYLSFYLDQKSLEELHSAIKEARKNPQSL